MKKVIKIILGISSISCIVFCIGVYLYAGQYTQPSADDFGISYNTKQSLADGHGYLSTAIKYTIETYLGWQGSYISFFILYITSIMIRYGVVGLKVLTIIIILCFYAALLYLTRSILKCCLSESTWYSTLIVYFILAVAISNMRIPTEIFYWYNAICVYTIPIICCVLGTAFLVRYFYTQKNRYWVWACLCGIIVGGASLQCTAIICFAYLLFVVYGYYRHKEGKHKTLLVFICSLMAALINVAAPGNYVRYDTVDSGKLHVFAAIKYAALNAVQESGKIITTPYLILVLCLGVLYGYYMRDSIKITIKHIGLIVVVAFMGMVISNFPVALGYSSMYMEARGYFILDMLIVITILTVIILIGIYVADKVKNYKNIIASCMVIVIIVVIGLSMNLMPTVICAQRIQDGTLEKFERMWDEAFSKIENTENTDVVIETKHFPDTGILKDPDFSTDSSYWVNQNAAKFFGKNSVALKYID